MSAIKHKKNFLNEIICGDALEVLKTIPAKSCQCCVTSPPYYGKRDYNIKGQIGLEDSPEEYIDNLVKVFNELHRVLKDSGTLWLNIADSYVNSSQHTQATSKLPLKNLMLIPERLIIKLQENNWIVRQEIIWQKTNTIPESVKDRFVNCYEKIFLLSKGRRYYFDYETAKEPTTGTNNAPIAGSKGLISKSCQTRRREDAKINTQGIPEQRTMRNIWKIPTAAKQGNKDHFAKFPNELAKRCIIIGSREEDVVIDPFNGSGTTCRIANNYGRNYIGIDINQNYCTKAREEIFLRLF